MRWLGWYSGNRSPPLLRLVALIVVGLVADWALVVSTSRTSSDMDDIFFQCRIRVEKESFKSMATDSLPSLRPLQIALLLLSNPPPTRAPGLRDRVRDRDLVLDRSPLLVVHVLAVPVFATRNGAT